MRKPTKLVGKQWINTEKVIHEEELRQGLLQGKGDVRYRFFLHGTQRHTDLGPPVSNLQTIHLFYFKHKVYVLHLWHSQKINEEFNMRY